jgi:hypothetical protein
MTATVAFDRVALEQRVEALSIEILATRDVLRKLDLLQERCELREVLATANLQGAASGI